MDTEAILERRRLRRRASFWRVAAFVILAAALITAFGMRGDWKRLEPGAALGEIADIKVDGFIDTRPDAVDLLKDAAEDGGVKAILLHINSPGGAASGGEALYRAVRSAAAEKPVVAVIDGLGASAAYLTAIAADHVIARESAITGSIGVIFPYGNVGELLNKLGVKYDEVKSAPLKGEPSLFHDPDPAAVAMLQAVVNDSYDWFVGIVADRRKLPPDEAKRLSDGSVYTGRQALRLKLVDGVGADEEALAWLDSEKRVSKDLPVRKWEKEKPILPFLGANARSGALSVALAGIARLAGIDLDLPPVAASLVPRRLAVDGLLSVWQAPEPVRSDR